MLIKLTEVASVIRSKNSGPYELTLDIMFKDEATFQLFCEKKLITPELIADLFQVETAAVLSIIEFHPAMAIKINLRRPIPSGAPGETDVYGAQQHAPLLKLSFEL